MTVPDARQFNWRFVTPSEPEGMLALTLEHECFAPGATPDLEAVVAAGPYPAVVVTDAGAAAEVFDVPSWRLVRALASAVQPGGWLLIGFTNWWSPLRRRPALRRSALRRLLTTCGFALTATYLPLPGATRPALLVPAGRPTELDHALRSLFLNYMPAGESDLLRRALPVARAAALRAPHRLRVGLAPAYYVLAERFA